MVKEKELNNLLAKTLELTLQIQKMIIENKECVHNFEEPKPANIDLDTPLLRCTKCGKYH